MDKLLNKLSSGRYVLTIIAGLVFAYATFAKILNSEAVGVILTAVFLNYFSRKRNGEEK